METRLAEALDAVEQLLNRYVVFANPHQAIVATLWTAHTHAVDAAETTPYLGIVSPEKRSGKTRLLTADPMMPALGADKTRDEGAHLPPTASRSRGRRASGNLRAHRERGKRPATATSETSRATSHAGSGSG